MVETDQNETSLRVKRNIGIWHSAFLSVGIIIGSGIFISPNGVIKAANGNVGVSLLIWVAGGVIATLSALCYGELVSSIPESGGNFIYFHFAYGSSIAFLVPWMNTFVPSSDALQLMLFANYALSPFFPPDCPIPNVAVKAVALLLLFIVCASSCFSVKKVAQVNSLLTLFKFLAIGLVILGAILKITNDNKVALDNFKNIFEDKSLKGLTFTSLTSAFYQVMWSYDGWTALTYITEEVTHSHHILRISIGTLAVVTFCYLVLNIAYLAVLTPAEMINSEVIASVFAEKSLGNVFWIVPLAVCLCTAGSYIGSVVSYGRVTFVAARRGYLPQIFGMIHVKRRTPAPGFCLNAFTAMILILIGDINLLFESFGFVTWTFHALISLAVLVIRRKRPDLPRPFKVPTLIPVFMFLMSIVFVVFQFIQNPHILYFYALAFFIVGIILHHVFVRKNIQIKGMDSVTLFIQKLFVIAPTTWDKID